MRRSRFFHMMVVGNQARVPDSIFKGVRTLTTNIVLEIIGLCKRKETAALKIKAAVSNGRVDRLLYDGFFSFAVVRQLVPFALILTSNPHRNVTDTRCFDRIMG